MAKAGTVTLELDANSVKLIRELQRAQGQTRRSGRSMQNSMRQAFTDMRKQANMAAKVVVASVAAVTAATAALIRTNMQNIDTLAKTAQSVDGTVASLQGLQLAGREAGVDVSAVASSAQILNQRLGEAARGTGEAYRALEQLGLNAQELQQLDIDERFAVISDRMQELGYNTSQSADALRSLGIRNREMVNLMQQGGNAIRGATDRVHEFGLAISDIDAAKIEHANDQLAFARDIAGRGMQEAAIAVAPVLSELANRFIDISNEAGGMGNVVANVLDGVVKAIGIAGNAFRGWVMIINGIKSAFYGLSQVTSTVFASMLEAMNTTFKIAADGINFMVRQLNRMPGINLDELVVGESEMAARLRSAAIDAQIEFNDAWMNLHEVASRPLPSEQFEEFVRQARIAADESAHAILEARERTKGGIIDTEELKETEEASKSFWQNWLEQAQSALTASDELVSNTLQNFASGMGQALERMVFDAESLRDAMTGMIEGIARNMVRALGEMAGQWLAYQAVQAAVGRSTQAAAAPALIANAQAASIQAGINAFASTAAIPIVGPAAAPAAMSAALAATQPMAQTVSSLALTGMAHDGIDSVPYEGTWLLDKGERVMTSETSAKLDRKLDELGGMAPIVNVYGQAEVKTGFDAAQQRQIIDIFVGDVKKRGRTMRTLTEYTDIKPKARQ